jgi:hypothetical protein
MQVTDLVLLQEDSSRESVIDEGMKPSCVRLVSRGSSAHPSSVAYVGVGAVCFFF